ncbi:hypothetical protein D6T63_12115 [Arthrobacter cheniae]|uniref:Integral membrane protein n=1 Tax=Arthrobacter cheniae TaxID=1258888 RepID=A0A3A5M573_9MICC|nr:hypothetical protein [Arthrobacter cheniae]RJT78272.1 hypothetical protein D6T63_12115 [Arthrobacter cheniae]
MVPDPVTQHPQRPRGVLVIAAILGLESVALALLAAASVVTIFSAEPVSVGGSVFMAVLLLLVAAGLGALAVKLAGGFRWPRSPSLVVQLFLVILSFPYFSSGNPIVGFLLMVPAAVVIVLLFSKRVLEFTVRTAAPERML